jgi:hypothetical protein
MPRGRRRVYVVITRCGGTGSSTTPSTRASDLLGQVVDGDVDSVVPERLFDDLRDGRPRSPGKPGTDPWHVHGGGVIPREGGDCYQTGSDSLARHDTKRPTPKILAAHWAPAVLPSTCR